MNLNQEQQEAFDALNDFLLSPDQFFLLKGSAGTGKTHVITYCMLEYFKHREFLKSLSKDDLGKSFRWVFTAPTHKAVSTIKNTITGHINSLDAENYSEFLNDCNVEFKTIHSVLNLVVNNDYKTGSTYITQKSIPAWLGREILIVDEYSMVDWQLFKYINSSPVKVIFLGDTYQLLPVAGKVSEAFESGLIEDKYKKTLTKIERQITDQNSGLVKLIAQARDTVATQADINFESDLPSLEVVTSKARLKECVHEYFIDLENVHNNKILAWQNNTVEAYNNYISENKFGTTDLVKGQEYVVSTITRPIEDITTESSVIITDLVVPMDVNPVTGTASTYIADFDYPYVSHKIKYIADRDVYNKHLKALKKVSKQDRDWAAFFELTNSVVDIRKPFAQTVHKSQGSTYDTVIVDVEDILQCRNKDTVRRLLYVAFSRPKSKLIVYLGEKYGP